MSGSLWDQADRRGAAPGLDKVTIEAPTMADVALLRARAAKRETDSPFVDYVPATHSTYAPGTGRDDR